MDLQNNYLPEVTTRYTLENWKDNDIQVYEIPASVLELEFEEVLKVAYGEICSLELNPVELTFCCVFLQNGWRVMRTPMREDSPVQLTKKDEIEQLTGVSDGLYGSGVPDLFLWNSDGEHRFIEVKASEHSLNTNQLEWAKTHDYNFYIAQLVYTDEDLSEDEIIEKNRIS